VIVARDLDHYQIRRGAPLVKVERDGAQQVAVTPQA